MEKKISKKPVGNILFSLSTEAKIYLGPFVVALVKKNGRSLYATKGTKDYFKNDHSSGMILVSKISQANDPEFTEAVRMEDLINKRLVSLIINVPSNEDNDDNEISEGELIRQLAKKKHVRLITSKEKAFGILHSLCL